METSKIKEILDMSLTELFEDELGEKSRERIRAFEKSRSKRLFEMHEEELREIRNS